mmetsp:Transcript_4613/g.6015  ORF Transcript_4613/g.6015 Transcript_4613/m.6015 type:complete len:262 (+) Transcript_4613:153-938(+)
MQVIIVASFLLKIAEVAFAFTPCSSLQIKTNTQSARSNEHPASKSVFQVMSKKNDVEDDRRSFLSTIAATSAIMPWFQYANPSVAFALSDSTSPSTQLSLYRDENLGFEVKIPATWVRSEQQLQDRRKIVLFVNSAEPEDKNDLVFVAYTPVRDDFTSLASFGSIDYVGQATILPKGELAGLDTENQMIFSESKKNAYYFDYTSKSPGQPKRHFRTIFALMQGATGGAGSVLVTITAQTLETRYIDLKNALDDIINSYQKI